MCPSLARETRPVAARTVDGTNSRQTTTAMKRDEYGGLAESTGILKVAVFTAGKIIYLS